MKGDGVPNSVCVCVYILLCMYTFVSPMMCRWSNMVAVGDEWKYGHPKLHKVAATEYWKG